MLVEPGLRGALSSTGGKLLGQKQRKVCEKEGGSWREGRGRKSGPQIRKREEEQRENRAPWTPRWGRTMSTEKKHKYT